MKKSGHLNRMDNNKLPKLALEYKSKVYEEAH
jgi:hypothetical protein